MTRSNWRAISRAADEIELEFGWRDIWVYATALQLDVTPKLSLRAGFNYSCLRLRRRTWIIIIAFPAIVKRRASGGFTYRLGRNWELTDGLHEGIQ